MKEVAEMLSKKKVEMNELEVPEELEVRLHQALNKCSPWRPAKHRWQLRIAVLLIALLLVGYQHDTLAYYGKKLMGYEQIMTGTLQELNELGKGQEIGKSYTVKNGITIVLDGIMLDDNQLVAFYTFEYPEGNIDTDDQLYIQEIQGEENYYPQSAIGEIDEETGEIRYIASYETPAASEKNLSLNFSLEDEGKILERGGIAFTLDRQKAMGSSLRQNLHKAVKTDKVTIRFKSIIASPTTTVINGSIQNIWELAWGHITGERIRPDSLNLRLIGNGQEIAWQGGEMSTDRKGITFEKRFDALPEDLEELKIELVSFGAEYDVNHKIELEENGLGQSLEISEQNIEINKVYRSGGDTYINITTEDSVVLSRVHLLIDGNRTALEETIEDNYDKKGGGTIYHTRTLRFPGTGEKLELQVERIRYEQNYNEVLDIPIK